MNLAPTNDIRMKKIALKLILMLLAPVIINAQTSFSVRTTGKLPFLEYGMGDDRLGGAKMTYLDTNVILTVVDSFKTDYKVQLSKYHSAYIDKRSVKHSGPSKVVDHLSSSWRVHGDSLFDYVAIG